VTCRSQRVLHPTPVTSLDEYRTCGGGRGLGAATRITPAEIAGVILAAGLRGRGGAGFPAGRKWQTVAANAEAAGAAAVVVNGAEGEPGTFKDRSIVRHNPYRVVEGACIAARAVGADRIVIALKRAFTTEVALVRRAIAEMSAAGMIPPALECTVFEGPDEYLYGEESALIETIDAGGPFPRVVPVYRTGLGGVPTLVNNVETIANVPRILDRGVAWFRSVGTPDSPGTLVCTVTGDTRRHGVGEMRAGTSLRQVIGAIGGGPHPGHSVKAVLSGVANRVITGDQLGVALAHEALAAIGSGLGAAGFIVFDDRADMVAVAAGVARFLAVESCGQCTPCKLDGAQLATVLARIAANTATPFDLTVVERRIRTVSIGARCYLGVQQETVLTSIFERFRHEFDEHLHGRAPRAEPVPIAELIDIREGVAVLDSHHAAKQPDWTYASHSSGCTPVDLRRNTTGGVGP